jgi:ABC-type transport system involved in multi-copper enzyme maturation permease subunit
MSAPAAPGGLPTPRESHPTPRNGHRDSAWSCRVLLGLGVAELRKALSTWAWWSLLLAAALLSLVVTFVPAKLAGLAFTPSMAQALALGTFGAKFAVLFGVVTATSEVRHRTITTSYLTAPGRPQLMVAKVVVSTLVGAGYAVVCSVCGLLGMVFGGGGAAAADELGTVVEVSLASLVVFGLWAALGVGVGTLLNNQLTAVLGVLVYLLLVEQIVVAIVSLEGSGRVDGYTPGGSASGVLSGLAEASPFGGSLSGLGLPWWLALMIFFGYAAVAVLAGAAAAQRRDIT